MPPPPEEKGTGAAADAPFGLPNAPLHRFTFDDPKCDWAFMDTYHGLPQWGHHGWTTAYLILWNGADHDACWFEKHRGRLVAAYDDWQGPHYGECLILHEIHLKPGVPPEARTHPETATIKLALRHLNDPLPSDGAVRSWSSIQGKESIDAGIFIQYQALFLQPAEAPDHDLIRSACFTRCVEDRFAVPDKIRLGDLDLEAAGGLDSCVEVTVPRQRFRKAYHEAIGHA